MLSLYSMQFKAMGSPCELKIYCSNQKMADHIRQISLDEVNRLEQKYTRFKPDSVTSIINQNAGQSKPVDIDNETFQLLNYANTLHEQSDGLFDITSGVLRRIWDFKSNQLPSEQQKAKILPTIGWNKVIWDEKTIHLSTKGMEIDFGGFVKEYTADVIATLCIENGVNSGLVNLGGDIKIIGTHPDNSPWRVGIQHPREPKLPIASVDMYAGGIATSGDYERYMIVNDVRYCHLLSPVTGNSIQPQYACISVIADTCLLAGSFSTTAMLKSQEDNQWLDESGLPYLKIDQAMKISGSINAYSE